MRDTSCPTTSDRETALHAFLRPNGTHEREWETYRGWDTLKGVPYGISRGAVGDLPMNFWTL